MKRSAFVALVVLAAVVLAIAASPGAAQEPCGGALQPSCPTPTPAPTSEPTPTATPPQPMRVSLRAQRPSVRAGASAKLTGRVTGFPEPSSPPLVRILARVGDEPFRKIGFTYPEANGRFLVYENPTLTTTYRVKVFDARSRTQRVVATPNVTVTGASGRRDRFVIIAAITVPQPDGARPRAGSSRAHFYVRVAGERRYRRIAKTGLRGISCNSNGCFRFAPFTLRDRALTERVTGIAACFSGRPFRDAGFSARCLPAGRAGELAVRP